MRVRIIVALGFAGLLANCDYVNLPSEVRFRDGIRVRTKEWPTVNLQCRNITAEQDRAGSWACDIVVDLCIARGDDAAICLAGHQKCCAEGWPHNREPWDCRTWSEVTEAGEYDLVDPLCEE